MLQLKIFYYKDDNILSNVVLLVRFDLYFSFNNCATNSELAVSKRTIFLCNIATSRASSRWCDSAVCNLKKKNNNN
jgi:hypothetical protein